MADVRTLSAARRTQAPDSRASGPGSRRDFEVALARLDKDIRDAESKVQYLRTIRAIAPTPLPLPDYSDPDYGLTAHQADTQRRIDRCSCGSWVVLGRSEWLALVEQDVRPECRHYAADVVA